MDLLCYAHGPRCRDRIAHGELDWYSANRTNAKKLLNALLQAILLVAIALKDPLRAQTLSIYTMKESSVYTIYTSVYHPLALFRRDLLLCFDQTIALLQLMLSKSILVHASTQTHACLEKHVATRDQLAQCLLITLWRPAVHVRLASGILSQIIQDIHCMVQQVSKSFTYMIRLTINLFVSCRLVWTWLQIPAPISLLVVVDNTWRCASLAQPW
jgi:hypothetical protein